MHTLEELIKQLPLELQVEVKDFTEFLLEKRKRKTRKKLRQDWAGGLKEYKDKFTSLELQKSFSVLGWLVYLIDWYKYIPWSFIESVAEGSWHNRI